MEIGLVDKMKIIFDVLFSSFMSIELILLFLLLVILVCVNMKYQKRFISILVTICLILAVLGFMIFSSSYVVTCFDSFIMKVMDYYYFPSTVVFFFLFLLAVMDFIYTMFSKKLGKGKKIFNYIFMSSIFFLFVMFVAMARVNGIDLADPVTLYQNKEILTVVQVSNFIFLLFVIVSIFYYLYLFFKKRFDQEKVES